MGQGLILSTVRLLLLGDAVLASAQSDGRIGGVGHIVEIGIVYSFDLFKFIHYFLLFSFFNHSKNITFSCIIYKKTTE